MPRIQRIYLDNAATSWPKPDSVYDAVDQFQRRLGCAAGRGGYMDGVAADRMVEKTRSGVAQLIHAAHPHEVVFTLNATDALNMALFGILREGDHVITSVMEHNSILRPLAYLRDRRKIGVSYLPVAADGTLDLAALEQQMTERTRLIALSHASNVTGGVLPIGEVAEIARRRQVRLLVDAAQSVGHWPVDVQQWNADLVAFSGHKGPLGPLGTGVLYVKAELAEVVEPFRQGGTGTQSEIETQPSTLPQKYEAGNLNVPGIVGLGAGVRFILDEGLERIIQHGTELTQHLRDRLDRLASVTVIGPGAGSGHVPVLSFQVHDVPSQEVAAMLDAAAGIQVRAGLHCAPRMHEALGTRLAGGTVRASLGYFNTREHVDQLVDVLAAAFPG
ncbi:MAG: cysteine desulfurase [Planctomycetales bacterium]|nr:cysteine desulfurase [Planctomycetales bacterium]